MSLTSFTFKLDVVWTPEEQQANSAILDSLEAANMHKFIHLDPKDKARMTKLGLSSHGWVNLSYNFGSANPQFLPAYVDLGGWKRDLDAMNYLVSFKQRLDKFSAALEDTLLLAGVEAYEAARLFYAALKTAVAARQPGAAAIYAQLASQFAKHSVDLLKAADPSLASAAPEAHGESEAESRSPARAPLDFEPPAMHE